jgi:general secretion pathway protein J
MRRRQGLTLIEVMVAITILAMVSVIIFGGFTQTIAAKRQVEAQADRVHVTRVALERMVRELSMAYTSTHLNPNPALQTVRTCFIGGRSGRGSRIDFTSFSHRRLYRDAHESDQNEISYFMAPHPEESGQYVLARREQRRIDDDPQTGGTIQILIEDIEGFELEFLDPQTGDWLDAWDAAPDGGQQANRLPTQVKIRVLLPNPNGRRPRVYATRAMPRITWATNHAIYSGGT